MQRTKRCWYAPFASFEWMAGDVMQWKASLATWVTLLYVSLDPPNDQHQCNWQLRY